MKLNSPIAIEDKRFEREIELFLGSTGREYWRRQCGKIAKCPDGFFKLEIFLKRNPLISPIRHYSQLRRAGKSVWKNRSDEIDLLARTAFQINKVMNSVNENARNQIKGRVRSGDNRSLLFELDIATHFLRNGFQVEFAEYECSNQNQRIFDFLVSRNSIEAEIECKWKSYDAGRKIRREDFYQLCDEIFRQLDSEKIRCLFEISCRKAFRPNHDIIKQIVCGLKSALADNRTRSSTVSDILISVIYLNDTDRIDSKDKFEEIVEPYRTPEAHFATLLNSKGTIIIKIQSEEKDRILKAIYDEIKKCLDQFSKTRPALIACHIEGVLPEEWELLKGENGLARMVTHFLNRENATHIHTLAFSSGGEVHSVPGIIDYSSPMLFFRNPNARFHWSENIFGFEMQRTF